MTLQQDLIIQFFYKNSKIYYPNICSCTVNEFLRGKDWVSEWTNEKNAIIVENSQMFVTSSKFWNYFNFQKLESSKLDNFEKRFLLFLNLLLFFEGQLHFLGEKWACAAASSRQ